MAEAYEGRRSVVVPRLNAAGLECPDPEGAFYVFPRIPAGDDDDVAFARDLVESEGVAVVPGSAFGEAGRGHVRMTLAASRANLERAMDGIDRFVAAEALRILRGRRGGRTSRIPAWRAVAASIDGRRRKHSGITPSTASCSREAGNRQHRRATAKADPHTSRDVGIRRSAGDQRAPGAAAASSRIRCSMGMRIAWSGLAREERRLDHLDRRQAVLAADVGRLAALDGPRELVDLLRGHADPPRRHRVDEPVPRLEVQRVLPGIAAPDAQVVAVEFGHAVLADEQVLHVRPEAGRRDLVAHPDLRHARRSTRRYDTIADGSTAGMPPKLSNMPKARTASAPREEPDRVDAVRAPVEERAAFLRVDEPALRGHVPADGWRLVILMKRSGPSVPSSTSAFTRWFISL